MSERVRLQPEDRRVVLLDAGAQLFGSLPYEDVRIDEVARVAGCSRALLYHYFPNKWALFRAIVDRADDQITQVTAPDPALPPLTQLGDGLRAYFRWAGENSTQYRTMCRFAALDPEMQQAMDRNIHLQRDRILKELPEHVGRNPRVRLVIDAWSQFVISLSLSWLDDRIVSDEDQLAQISVSMLVSALQAVLA